MGIGVIGGSSDDWENGLGPRRGLARGIPNRPLLQNLLCCVCERSIWDTARTSLTPGLPGIISINPRATRDTRRQIPNLSLGGILERDFKTDRISFEVQLPCLLTVSF